MSSISPLNSNSEALYAASLTSAPATSSSNPKSKTADPSAQGTAPQDTVSLTRADAREVIQMGRIAYQQQAGKLTADQGAQLDAQIETLQTTIASDVKANGGTLSASDAQSIASLQNGISRDIYGTAHNTGTGNNPFTRPAVPAPTSNS